jgi:hypothetical protein
MGETRKIAAILAADLAKSLRRRWRSHGRRGQYRRAAEGIAKPGAICLSEDAYRQVKAPFGQGSRRNDAQEHCQTDPSLRAVGDPPLASPTSQSKRVVLDRVSEAPEQPDRPSIAVLPFQNMSGDPEQEYFADGRVEDIITALSRFKSLFVIARNSSFTTGAHLWADRRPLRDAQLWR